MTEIQKLRHSTAHVMAAAICRIYPNVKLDIGPPTSEGFYYDMDLDVRITPDDFENAFIIGSSDTGAKAGASSVIV